MAAICFIKHLPEIYDMEVKLRRFPALSHGNLFKFPLKAAYLTDRHCLTDNVLQCCNKVFTPPTTTLMSFIFSDFEVIKQIYIRQI